MYYAEQDLFLNAACMLETKLGAEDLLDRLQRIEKDLGRIETFKNGPRSIDLDVLLYGMESISSNRLIVPHPKIAERPFVLKPLLDILPKDTRHPYFSETFAVRYLILQTDVYF
jgi:2-amino-4-hydroxy-6-hydroxymethyldihydropteridine diphosphokinase